jgi:hypothetical protein
MPFENFCKLWSLTSDFGGITRELDLDKGAVIFKPLVALFEAWAARHAPLTAVVNVLRIAAATEQLIHALHDTNSIERCAESLVQLNELEQQTTATESAAQRFRQVHKTLAAAVTQTLEAGGDALPPGFVEARDAAFLELRMSLQLLEECSSRLSLDALHAATSARLTPMETALTNLERTTGVQLAAMFEDGIATSDNKHDRTAVDDCGAMLRRVALSMLQTIQHSAMLAQQFAEQCLTRDGDKMLQAASTLRDSICSIIALEGEAKDVSLSAVLRESTPWAALLSFTAQRLAPLRAVNERAGSLQRRAASLRAEVDAFVSGFAGREQGTLLLEETHKAMRRARASYGRLQVENDANTDDESDAGGVDPEELARRRDICRAATASRDKAARLLFRAAKVYHPETLVQQQKRMRELLQIAYMRQTDGVYAYVDVERPAYWHHQEHTGSWLVRESTEVATQVEKLLNDTASPEEHGTGRDSHDLPFARFKVTSVQRVENSVVWSAYAARRRARADTLACEGYALPESARRLSTSHFLYPVEGGSLEDAAGEVFLFHGTKFPESIASSGFDVRYAYAGAGAGAMFGRGVYFAESASKSDQYVSRSAAGKLTLVLARVCLGRCQVVRDGHGRRNAPFLPEVEGKSTPVVPLHYDSILTEVPGMRFREIVVGRDTAAYPELLVEYERV